MFVVRGDGTRRKCVDETSKKCDKSLDIHWKHFATLQSNEALPIFWQVTGLKAQRHVTTTRLSTISQSAIRRKGGDDCRYNVMELPKKCLRCGGTFASLNHWSNSHETLLVKESIERHYRTQNKKMREFREIIPSPSENGTYFHRLLFSTRDFFFFEGFARFPLSLLARQILFTNCPSSVHHIKCFFFLTEHHRPNTPISGIKPELPRRAGASCFLQI